jgi:hypothetical protein
MKKTILCTVIALSLFSTATSAAALSSEEQSYVAIALNPLSVANLCDYNIVNGGLAKLGDRTGVDNKIGDATVEAIKAAIGTDYDSSLLIPEVTRFVNAIIGPMAEATKNKPAYCRKFAPVLLNYGTIEKK